MIEELILQMIFPFNSFTDRTYRVFIYNVFFSKILKYILGSSPLDVCTVSVYTPDRYMAALSPKYVDNGEHSLELYLDF